MNGPSYVERIESIEYATESDFTTTISIEPLLDLRPDNLIKELIPKLSKLNYEMDQGIIWIGLLKKRYIPVHLRVGILKNISVLLILQTKKKNSIMFIPITRDITTIHELNGKNRSKN